MLQPPPIRIDENQLEAFCRRWQITELALFGSVLRGDFRADSDVDVLATFAEDYRYTLRDLMMMEDELRALFGRDVDLGDRQTVESDPNYIRRNMILNSLQVIYANR
jgi:uncharacterized protein